MSADQTYPPLEAIARELCIEANENPEQPRWWSYLEQARAILGAHHAQREPRVEPS